MELRKSASLLMEHGHARAWNYPVGFLQDEYTLAVQRVESGRGTEASLLQLAVMGIWSKKANKVFKSAITALTGSEK